jgi:hypothetical protein
MMNTKEIGVLSNFGSGAIREASRSRRLDNLRHFPMGTFRKLLLMTSSRRLEVKVFRLTMTGPERNLRIGRLRFAEDGLKVR